MTDDRIAWLRDQITADIRTAELVLRFSRESYARTEPEAWVAERKVNNEQPPYFDHWIVRTDRPGTVEREIFRIEATFGGTDAEHIARFASPRRVLLDLNAKWEMLDDIVAVPAYRREPLLKAVAGPYTDRPGCPDEFGQRLRE